MGGDGSRTFALCGAMSWPFMGKPLSERRTKMPTYRAIRKQVRQAIDKGRLKHCSQETLNLTCMLFHAMATGQTDRLLDAPPPGATREDVHEMLAHFQAAYAEEIRVVRAEAERLFAA